MAALCLVIVILVVIQTLRLTQERVSLPFPLSKLAGISLLSWLSAEKPVHTEVIWCSAGALSLTPQAMRTSLFVSTVGEHIFHRALPPVKNSATPTGKCKLDQTELFPCFVMRNIMHL